jgi:hypothetical protein
MVVNQSLTGAAPAETGGNTEPTTAGTSTTETTTGNGGMSHDQILAQAVQESGLPTSVEPAASGSVAAQEPVTQGVPTPEMTGGVFSHSFKEGEVSPEVLARINQHFDGFNKAHGKLQAELTSAASTLSALDKMVETPQGARQLIETLAAQHGLQIGGIGQAGLGQAGLGQAGASATGDVQTEAEAGPFGLPKPDDFFADPQVEALRKQNEELLRMVQPIVQERQMQEQKAEATRQITAALPAINQAMQVVKAGVAFTTEQVMSAIEKYGLVGGDGIDGIVNALKLDSFDSLVAGGAAAPAAQVPAMLGNATAQPAEIAITENMTREQRNAAILHNTLLNG